MNLSDAIRIRRKELGLTLKDVADKIGVAEATVQRYESGNIKNVRHERIVKIAAALEMPPSELMGWNDIEPEKANWTIEPLSESPSGDNSIPVELKRGVFANNVKKYMLKNNVCQKDICDMLGVNSSLVSKWLDGDELPNIKTVDALADFLHVKRNNLLDKKNTTYKNNQEKTTALSDDALEVANAYAALPDDNAKNMIRGALGLSALKRGIVSANNVELSGEISASVVDDIAGLLFESDAEKREHSVSPDIKDA